MVVRLSFDYAQDKLIIKMKQNIYEIRIKKIGSDTGAIYQIPSENEEKAIAEATTMYITTLMESIETEVLSVNSKSIK